MKVCIHLITTIDIQTMSYTLYYNVCNIYKQWVMFTKQANLYTGMHIEVGHMHITLSVKLCLFSMHAKSVLTTEAN